MSFLNTSNKSFTYHLAIEVADRSVYIKLLTMSKKEILILAQVQGLHYATTKDGLNQRETSKLTRVLNNLFQKLRKSVDKLVGESRIHIESSMVILGHPWFSVTELDNLRIGKDGEPAVISLSTIHKMLESGSNTLEVAGQKHTILEKSVSSIKVNGYTINDLSIIGGKNVTVTASLFSTLTSLRQMLLDMVEFHTATVPTILSYPRAISLSEQMNIRGNSVAIMVDTDSTTITSNIYNNINLGGAYKIHSIDMGSASIIEEIALQSKSNKELATSAIKLKDEGMLSSANTEYIDAVSDVVVYKWRDEILRLIGVLDLEWTKKIVFCRDKKFQTKFLEALNNSDNTNAGGYEEAELHNIIFNKRILSL